MPNWCHDTLTVSGWADELARFVEAAAEKVDDVTLRRQYDSTLFIGDEVKPTFAEWVVERRKRRQPLSFEVLVPVPPSDDVWDNVTSWGTKWDANFDGLVMALGAPGMNVEETMKANGVTVTPEIAVYKFVTAHSPPEPYVEKVSGLFPELEFELKWAEVGNDLAGSFKYVAGVKIDEEDLEVKDVLAPEEMWF